MALPGTIRENIRYGRPGASDEEVEAAARACYVDHIVRALPEGYETVLEEEAANISAGERQLLTIARAFIADPAVLILDEATSSVDTRTELLVQRAMGALRRGRTSFVIAHRLSTIATRTRSWSWSVETLSSRAVTPSCWSVAAPMRAFMPRSSPVLWLRTRARRTGADSLTR